MILWRLRGYSDPECEFQGGDVVCSVERTSEGYRLLVEHAGQIQTDETHGTARLIPREREWKP